jgi:hypothetical protein
MKPALAFRPSGLALLLAPRRLLWVGIAALLWFGLLSLIWEDELGPLLVRTSGTSAAAMLMFGLLEQWPPRLPRWIARWVLQVLAVAAAVPISAWLFWTLSTPPGAPPFYEVQDRLGGFASLTVTGLLFAPWFALGALVRQKDALARYQALEFDLQRSELERQAVDARLRLLQAQVAPHFLFNTLANVRVLVESGAPQAPQLLDSLIAYLRAAVPRLDGAETDLAQELALTRAYLKLMQMRIPDRLQFSIEAEESVLDQRCPPMSLLTLVENAVRHGIDPSEEGGAIDIRIRGDTRQVSIRVCDSGIGLQAGSRGLGTGLSSLRERLRLVFGEAAQLRLSEVEPHGLLAEISLPRQSVAAV